MIKLGQGESSEVVLARIVEPKATASDVKEFAHRMIDDHSRGWDKLEAIAKHEGVTLVGGMDAEHREFEAKLAKERTGEPYDRTYIDEMVMDHQKDAADLRDAIKEIDEPQFKAWAEEALKTVEAHLAMAKEIRAKMR